MTPWDKRWLGFVCKFNCSLTVFGCFGRRKLWGGSVVNPILCSFELYRSEISVVPRDANCKSPSRSEGAPSLDWTWAFEVEAWLLQIGALHLAELRVLLSFSSCDLFFNELVMCLTKQPSWWGIHEVSYMQVLLSKSFFKETCTYEQRWEPFWIFVL